MVIQHNARITMNWVTASFMMSAIRLYAAEYFVADVPVLPPKHGTCCTKYNSPKLQHAAPLKAYRTVQSVKSWPHIIVIFITACLVDSRVQRICLITDCDGFVEAIVDVHPQAGLFPIIPDMYWEPEAGSGEEGT